MGLQRVGHDWVTELKTSSSVDVPEFYLFIWLCHVAWELNCGMWDLVPWPAMEPQAPKLGAQSLSHYQGSPHSRILDWGQLCLQFCVWFPRAGPLSTADPVLLAMMETSDLGETLISLSGGIKIALQSLWLVWRWHGSACFTFFWQVLFLPYSQSRDFSSNKTLGKLVMECRQEQGQGGGVFLERKHQHILICKDLKNPSLQGHSERT